MLSTTGGEGFGLTSVEAMACEVPVVITDYTSFSYDTEVVTNDGIKNISSLKEGDLVFSLNEKTNELELKPVKVATTRPFDGYMVNINNRHIDLLVTPDHKILAKKQGSYNIWGNNYDRIYASDIHSRSHWKLPVKGTWKGARSEQFIFTDEFNNSLEIYGNENLIEKALMNNLLSLMGWYISEGYIRTDKCKVPNKVSICNSSENYRKEIIILIKNLGNS